jgi:hypothetical protein
VHILAATSVPFGPTTVQMPNLALIETKYITVYKTVFTLPKVIIFNVREFQTNPSGGSLSSILKL